MRSRAIEGYPNYEILEIGVVRNIKTGRIIEGSAGSKGYIIVKLYNNGKAKTVKMHRLVAEAFIPNLDNKPQVNHIDGVKSNNSVDNLEWVTNGENGKHAYDNGLRIMTDEWKSKISKSNTGKKKTQEAIDKIRKNNSQSKSVIQLDLDGLFVNRFSSTKEAERETGIRSSNISNCCHGKRRQAKGFKWVFAEDYNE
jgi:hypothetical protein